MAAEVLASAGISVTVFEHTPSLGRKLLLAGRSGLNLTNAEPTDQLISRYGDAQTWLEPAIRAFDAGALRRWVRSLGIETYVGSTGRVFPDTFTAADLVRAWNTRLDDLGVNVQTRHRWTGLGPLPSPSNEDAATTSSQRGPVTVMIDGPSRQTTEHRSDVVILALGGASWPKVGSDGTWTQILADRGVLLAPFRPSNCGVIVEWSAPLLAKHEGSPLKNVRLTVGAESVRGEAVITESGFETGVIYALGSTIRGEIDRSGHADLTFDLQPDLAVAEIESRLRAASPKVTVSRRLMKAAGINETAVALIRESVHNVLPSTPEALARLIKQTIIRTTATEGLDRAISTAGGIRSTEVDRCFAVNRLPGVFAVGEMLDWDAPTGGYLLQATFSTAVAAARRAADLLGCGEVG